jgi:hypothetical protein
VRGADGRGVERPGVAVARVLGDVLLEELRRLLELLGLERVHGRLEERVALLDVGEAELRLLGLDRAVGVGRGAALGRLVGVRLEAADLGELLVDVLAEVAPLDTAMFVAASSRCWRARVYSPAAFAFIAAS